MELSYDSVSDGCSGLKQARCHTRHDVFERVVVPHLADAYRVARSFTGNHADADDVLQEASLRLFRFAISYRGGDARSWVLRVVRNAALSWLRANRRRNHVNWGDHHGVFLEAERSPDADFDAAADPMVMEEQRSETEMLRSAISELSNEQREVMMLRNLQGLAYREIAQTLSIPIGTVMSRLSRAHSVLERRLACRSRRVRKVSADIRASLR